MDTSDTSSSEPGSPGPLYFPAEGSIDALVRVFTDKALFSPDIFPIFWQGMTIPAEEDFYETVS
jgi:hypothetical protein